MVFYNGGSINRPGNTNSTKSANQQGGRKGSVRAGAKGN